MRKFTTLTSIAAPLDLINIDTDMIIPKQFLKTIKRTGLGKSLFFEMRYDNAGNEIKDFILNQDGYKNSEILIAGDNFGCGSSREHAPWSLIDFGIKCVIAPSFADIFYNNCFKNGILPITLEEYQVSELIKSTAESAQELTIDLLNNKIITKNNEINFTIDDFRKKCLIEGLDDIALTLKHKQEIDDFELKNSQKLPWLYNN
ncbi:3-isopropylmalate dehydratase small subunit [Rickettsiales bacterium]|nr:3-isopropylmalate dehydratase small subunit [Rickettsiales bacterium]